MLTAAAVVVCSAGWAQEDTQPEVRDVEVSPLGLVPMPDESLIGEKTDVEILPIAEPKSSAVGRYQYVQGADRVIDTATGTIWSAKTGSRLFFLENGEAIVKKPEPPKVDDAARQQEQANRQRQQSMLAFGRNRSTPGFNAVMSAYTERLNQEPERVALSEKLQLLQQQEVALRSLPSLPSIEDLKRRVEEAQAAVDELRRENDLAPIPVDAQSDGTE